jgi:hypothetical protein
MTQPTGNNKQRVIWLASFPRSGNTFLRTILNQCFGQKSASLYPNDLDGNTSLENYVGHIEPHTDGMIYYPAGNLPFMKTHAKHDDSNPAIYVVRDGREACVSMYHFYHREISLDAIIAGKSIFGFGTWSAHLEAWQPWGRPNTLLLKYEDMVSNLEETLQAVSLFLGKEIVAHQIPDRESIAGVDGRHVRKKIADRHFPEQYLELFNQVNGRMMEKMGYYP